VNDYLKEFRSIYHTDHPTINHNSLLRQIRPKDWGSIRETLIFKYSFAIPDDNIIQMLARLSPLIEIGAGTSYWAKLITEAGGDIIAFDTKKENRWTESYFDVQNGSCEHIKKHKDRTLFLCWSPYWNDMDIQCLKLYEGQTVIYVGEGQHGCTGTNEFFEYLDEHFKEIDWFSLPQWPGMHDGLSIWKRTEESNE